MNSKLVEIKIYGRGGQGVVTAANLLAKAAFFDGLWSQAIPFFGAERRGAPVVSMVRLSNTPIRIHNMIRNPDVAVVFDYRLLHQIPVLKELKKKGKLVINVENGELLNKEVNDAYETYVLDAIAVAVELNMFSSGIPIVNTALLGAIAKTGIVPLKSVVRAIEEQWHGELAENNVKAAQLGFLRTFKVGEKSA